MLGVVEDEGGGGVDRHRPRVRRGVRLLAGVDLEGGETLHLRLGVVARLVSLSVSPPPTGSGPGVRGVGSPSWSPLPFARWGRDGGQVRPPPGPPPGPLGPLGPLPRGDGPPSASDGRALSTSGCTCGQPGPVRPAATARAGAARAGRGRGGGAVRGVGAGAPRRAVRWSAPPRARAPARAAGRRRTHRVGSPWASGTSGTPRRPARAVVPFALPQTGEGIAECEVVQWHVQVGDLIERFEPLVEVQSDKATMQQHPQPLGSWKRSTWKRSLDDAPTSAVGLEGRRWCCYFRSSSHSIHASRAAPLG